MCYRSLQSGIVQLMEDMKSGRDRSALKRRGVIRRLAEMLDADVSDKPQRRERDFKLRRASSLDSSRMAASRSDASEALRGPGSGGFSGTELIEKEKKLGTKLEALDAEVELLHATLVALQANRIVFETRPTAPACPPPTRSKVKSRKQSKKDARLLFEDWRL